MGSAIINYEDNGLLVLLVLSVLRLSKLVYTKLLPLALLHLILLVNYVSHEAQKILSREPSFEHLIGNNTFVINSCYQGSVYYFSWYRMWYRLVSRSPIILRALVIQIEPGFVNEIQFELLQLLLLMQVSKLTEVL